MIIKVVSVVNVLPLLLEDSGINPITTLFTKLENLPNNKPYNFVQLLPHDSAIAILTPLHYYRTYKQQALPKVTNNVF